MNRTLLLILCDFLLLNLLALTRWEQAEPSRIARTPAPAAQGSAASQRQDILETMKLSLEDEQAARELLARRLEKTQTELESREQNVALLESQRSDLSARMAAAEQDAALNRARLAQTQRELEEKRRQAEDQARQLTSLNEQQVQARARIEGLSVAVKVAEREKELLRETTVTLRTQVDTERKERIRVQETATQLAQGVGQLAEQSTSLTKEIRDNRPVSANTLFSEFLAGRVQMSFTASRRNLLGPVQRDKTAGTVLVTDGRATYAVLHVEDTALSLREVPENWEGLTATFRKGGYSAGAPEMTFLSVDPRVVAIPVTPAQVEALGAKVYQVALDPFKFPEAVLISSGGAGYGEVPFKLEAGHASYVRMDNRLFRRLFGDFSPSRGDLVLSKTGEFLGIMVNAEYCAVVDNFLPAQSIRMGETTPMAAKLRELNRRYRSLPLRLQ